jgi:hypothetical protein
MSSTRPKQTRRRASRHADGPGFALVKVISGYRITLPERIRGDYNLEEGTRLALVRGPEGWLISRAAVTATRMNGKPLELPLPQMVD